MLPISEKWQMSIRGKSFIISNTEMEMIVNAGEARFVRFRDMVINPAYIEYMVKVQSDHVGAIEAPDESDKSSDEWLKNHI